MKKEKKQKQYKKWQILELYWIDSMQSHRWKHESELETEIDDKYLNQKSIGYLYRQTNKSITIVQSKSNDGDPECNVAEVLSIPKIAVTKIRAL